MPQLEMPEQNTCLTFKLEDEMFAVGVQNVREVLKFETAAKIPGAPDFVRGIINLRGMALPVVDLRLKFGMSKTETTRRTCVIVLELGGGEERTVLGALADSVHEVLEFEPGQIEPPPRFGGLSGKNCIQGVGRRGDRFVILLDINKVFSTTEVVMLGSATESDPDLEDEEATETA